MRPEEREWTNANQREIPETNDNIRFCKVCKKTLSKFNLDNYCFVHKYVLTILDDELRDKKSRELEKYYRGRYANTGTNSKRTKRNSATVLSQSNHK